MKKFFFLVSFVSSLCFAQVTDQEFELIKTYKQNLTAKDMNQTILALQQLINYYKGETQYHISLGYMYQLQRNRKLAKYHLEKGRSYILEQLVTKQLSAKETMYHVVALCFAGFEKDCQEMFDFSEARFVNDESYNEYDYESIKILAENQRNNLKEYFSSK